MTPDLGCYLTLNGACPFGVDCSSVYDQLYGNSGLSGNTKVAKDFVSASTLSTFNVNQDNDANGNGSVSSVSGSDSRVHATVDGIGNGESSSSAIPEQTKSGKSFIVYAVIGLVVLLAIIGVVAFFIDRTRTARDGRVESENKLRPLTSIHGQDAFHLYTAKEKDKFASINESQYGQAAHSKRSSQANQSINRRLSSTHLTESVISDHSIYAASTSSTPSEHFMSSYTPKSLEMT